MSDPNFPKASAGQIRKGRYLAAISYGGLVFLAGRWRKDNPFIAYHARQAMVFVIWFIILAVGTLGGVLLTAWMVVKTAGRLAICPTLFVIFSIPLIILTVIAGVTGAIKAGRGKFWKMPVLGEIAERWFK